ncbi:hypothetical protein UR09_05725 [Candidatus Nitromaritima sp. SCGC AAA799-A02]|nr:hypothetical protein UR09_05725 [Candidatus Nitromaritima sp. SCGC AAA799-A02]
MTAEPKLTDLFDSFPNLELSAGDLSTYKTFRCQETQLVSCLDNREKEPEVLVLREKGEPIGTVSLAVMENPQKTSPANQYARIDLVIVIKARRKLGVGHLLILCAIIYLLRTRKDRLYSISCLAAHKAVEKVLKELSFQELKGKEKEGFLRCALNLENLDLEDLIARFVKQTSQCIQQTNFRLRQRPGTL